MKQYPLIKKLGLTAKSINVDHKTIIIRNDYIHADDLEQVLQNATVVTCKYENGQVTQTFGQVSAFGETHKALLIAIEPLEEKKVTITRADLEKAFKKFNIIHHEDLEEKTINQLAKELGL